MADTVCKVASAQNTSGCAPDHTRMWSHSYLPVLLEKPRETAPTPQEGNELSVSFQHPLPPCKLQLSISPLKPYPGFADQTSAELPVPAEPCGSCLWLVSLACAHLGLRILPDAGREKLNKTVWRGMIRKRNFLTIPGVHRNSDKTYAVF